MRRIDRGDGEGGTEVRTNVRQIYSHENVGSCETAAVCESAEKK